MLSACKTATKIVEVPVEVVKKEYIHDTKIDSVLFAYEDDFTEYLNRLNSLNSELKLIKTELNNLFVDIRSFIHTSKMGSNDVKNLNQVMGIQSLFNLLIRSMEFAEIEIKADEKTLQSFDYSV